ncbi:MAG: tRNA-uridine aminocarboxypropyltransferase [Myxococcota bacterium]|nr:tRNA-uridine aminocarboxypropyltransferase [Myxococcota bacterium]
MRAFTPHGAGTRCPACLLRHETCICNWLPRISNRMHVHIVRHSSELRRPTNSARIAALALQRCTLVDHGLPHVRFDPAPVSGDDTWLLFPEGHPPDDRSAPAPPAPRTPVRRPRVLVVLDGNWGQARRMSKRLPVVRDLPRLAVPPPRPGTHRLRRPHAPWAMATIEAIARAFDALGEPDVGAALDAVFLEFVRRTRIQRGEPAEGWRPPGPSQES